MSNVKYSVVSHVTSPVVMYPADSLFIEPVRYLKYITTIDERQSTYIKCPAFIDFFKNVFVLQSPIDIEFIFDKEAQNLYIHGERGIDQTFFDNLVAPRGNQTKSINDRYLLSIGMIQLLFYTEDPVTIEVLPNFTIYNSNTNYNIIPAQFRIDKWIRPVEFAFEFIDENKPVTIKRGDPLFTFRLNPKDDSKVDLTRELCTDVALFSNVMNNHTLVKNYVSNLPLKGAYELAAPYIKHFWRTIKGKK